MRWRIIERVTGKAELYTIAPSDKATFVRQFESYQAAIDHVKDVHDGVIVIREYSLFTAEEDKK